MLVSTLPDLLPTFLAPQLAPALAFRLPLPLQVQRLEILHSGINRLLRKHPPLHLPELAKVLLPIPLIALRALLLQHLFRNPRTLRTGHLNPLPPFGPVGPFVIE